MGRKLSKIYTPYNIVLTLILFIMPNLCSANEQIIEFTGSPQNVVDGDSLQHNNLQIRLLGIDAPEYNQQCKDNNNKLYNCGQQSKQFLIDLINNKTITCTIHSKDKFKRDLCTCYIENTDIASTLVENGQSIAYINSSYTPKELEAKKLKKGLWQGDFMHPRLFRIINFK